MLLIFFGRPIVPKRVGKTRKDGHVHAQDEDENLLLLDRKATVERAPTQVESKVNVLQRAMSSRITQDKSPKRRKDDSDTEDDEELLLDQPSGKEIPLPTPTRSITPPNVDPGRAPGRIIGNTYPLKDFEKNIAQGDVVTKAVQDLGDVIVEIVLKPFAWRRHREMIECMGVLRKTCLEVCNVCCSAAHLLRDSCFQEDEIDAWNSFLRNLKEKCVKEAGNPTFWKEVSKGASKSGLIMDQEARKQGGESTVTEKEGSEVCFLINLAVITLTPCPAVYFVLKIESQNLFVVLYK